MELITATTDSVTVTWPAVEGAKRYVLEYRQVDNDDDGSFQVLSDKLSQTQARKRNLSGDKGFIFRVGAITSDEADATVSDWVTHPEPFQLLTTDAEQAQMEAPKVVHAGSNQALLISWKKKSNGSSEAETTKYELQMRENRGGEPWTTIAKSLSNTEVKKKNLTSTVGYQFRVRQAGVSDETDTSSQPFSPPSDPVVARGLSQAMKRWFQSLENNTLLRSGSKDPIPLEDALGGKEFVLLYASASWCPPCRKFTPMLANWYKSLGPTRPVEVVFLSGDQDENSFMSYFNGHHPWLAVDFDEDAREGLQAHIRVTGIPRLVVIHAETGRIIVDNAVGQQFDLNQWRMLAAKK